MKRLFFITASVFLFSYASSVIATTQPNPIVKPSSTPLTQSPTNKVGLRLMNQWQLVAIDMKNGKITQAQAVSIRADLKSIHKQQSTFLKASANHQLTANQTSQLNSLLDQNSLVLGETPASN